ncbi:leucine rich repeat containing 56 [Nesidiocoris tenuis]|uniref:Leucine rich repeat containing 56 n=1 Tax=Nesidiocoris tenuis TaxID=355587 RepID=A0ABN7AG01_9HEMI|nr:leucine rich repeat containing 56 [Nesidiocoris tenuis]
MSYFFEEDKGDNDPLDDEAYHANAAIRRTGQLDIVGLLTQVAETHDLQSVQSIKLKVMTKDLPLHSLHTNLPGLKELDLDSSYIHSLRELGTDLGSLQVLRLGHCRLESLDGILAFKNLKEFSAPNNYVTDLGLACQLPHIIYFDISRNFIDHWNQLSFFKDATTLEEMLFQGNPGARLENYRDNVIQHLQQLVVLDGVKIAGREHRKTSPVLRAHPPLVKTRSGRTSLDNMSVGLCGNLTTAIAHNKKRQKSVTAVANNANENEDGKPGCSEQSKSHESEVDNELVVREAQSNETTGKTIGQQLERNS